MVSLAIIVYVMALAVPRVQEERRDGDLAPKGAHAFEKLDEALLKSKDKFLRRAKVVVMKADNLISKQLRSRKDRE